MVLHFAIPLYSIFLQMKSMYPMFQEISRRMVDYLQTKHSNGDTLLELRDLSELYTTDNVAASIFGLEGNCFNEKLSMFRKLSKEYPAPDVWKYIRSTIVFCLPSLDKIIKLRYVRLFILKICVVIKPFLYSIRFFLYLKRP